MSPWFRFATINTQGQLRAATDKGFPRENSLENSGADYPTCFERYLEATIAMLGPAGNGFFIETAAITFATGDSGAVTQPALSQVCNLCAFALERSKH